MFSKDPTVPILLPVGYIGELWLNDFLTTPVNAGGLGMGKVRPSLTRLACCHMEVTANKTLVDWTDEDHVVYPAAKSAPRDDTTQHNTTQSTNRPTRRSTIQIDEDDNANDDANDEPADDDKSEHDDDDDESDKNTTPQKEDDESEDESDDEPKSPKDQSAVSRDSGLGGSSASQGIGAGASVSSLSHPSSRQTRHNSASTYTTSFGGNPRRVGE